MLVEGGNNRPSPLGLPVCQGAMEESSHTPHDGDRSQDPEQKGNAVQTSNQAAGDPDSPFQQFHFLLKKHAVEDQEPTCVQACEPFKQGLHQNGTE